MTPLFRTLHAIDDLFKQSIVWAGICPKLSDKDGYQRLTMIYWSDAFLPVNLAFYGFKVIRALHGSEGGFVSKWLYQVGLQAHPLDSGKILGLVSVSSPLCMRFSRLFCLEREKDCLIRDRISNSQWKWNWSRSILGSRNSTHLNHMLANISQIEVREGPNKCIWSTAHDGMFFVGALRRLINDHMLPSLVIKTTWDKTLPRKVNIFMWRLKLDRLPYRLNLSSRGIEIPEISCPSCNGNVESNVHIFFECSFTKDVLKTIRRWCDNTFPLFNSNTYWIEWLASWYGSQVKKKCLLVIIAATLWLIW
ncbi:RNA-directed DNA polymerase, eukaryota, partial [Tanacetum coccineum]